MQYKTVMLTVDESLMTVLKQIEDEGWRLVGELKPVAIYQLCRDEQSDLQPKATMTIDDSKVFVIRGGKPVPEGG